MKVDQRIKVFVNLGLKIQNLTKEELEEITSAARNENAWFTSENVTRALKGIQLLLDEKSLLEWLENYTLTINKSQRIGIIMAGNIPMVGFHDLLCVCLSGHEAMVKMSRDDTYLMTCVIDWIKELDVNNSVKITIAERLNDAEALIATGSDNSARYFEYYFRSVPKIIRKNRTSLAILSGKEDEETLSEIGKDIFWYFGLGCRNISKLLIPKDYDIAKFYEAIERYEPVIHHHKYRNNYDYHKSIFLVNGDQHLDNGFLLLKESEQVVSPLTVLYYQRFENDEEMTQYIDINKEKIQCIVGEGFIPFGKAQLPEVWDYADGVDTIEFCLSL
ncbi:MAG: acyl-CoA reductase [Cyclobacteriaceae bacterium]